MPLLHHAERPTGDHWRVLLFSWMVWLTGFASLMLLSFVLEEVKETTALPLGHFAA